MALAVGQGQGDAVKQYFNAAHPESGAGAQTTQAESVALGKVVAVGDEEAGYRPQRLVERETRAGAVGICDDRSGYWEVVIGAYCTGGGDFGGGQLVARCIGCG